MIRNDAKTAGYSGTSFPRLVLYCVQVTIPLTVCIYILSLVLGFLLALIQIQKIPVLKQLARVYVWVFRGTPLIVQMYIIFFGLPSLGITLDAFPSAVIAFSLNYAAYMSETIRAAIQSVPEGQWEAGYMIGLSSGQIMLRVILPQAARVAFPHAVQHPHRPDEGQLAGRQHHGGGNVQSRPADCLPHI